jgi:hypothetical protein
MEYPNNCFSGWPKSSVKQKNMTFSAVRSHNNTPGLCRDCNMTTQNADNPDVPCQFHRQKDLALLPPDSLKTLSFLHVENNAFKGINFGASPYGINCATAIDIIHFVLIGLLEYLHNTFIDQLTRRQATT